MMESAEASARIHGCLPRWPLFDWPVMRGVLREAVVNPILVKVRNVVTDEAPQVLFVQGNHVVQHFPPTATHPSLSDTVLPRVAVGTVITDRPPHRSVRARLTHTAPTLDIWRQSEPRDRGAPGGAGAASGQSAESPRLFDAGER